MSVVYRSSHGRAKTAFGIGRSFLRGSSVTRIVELDEARPGLAGHFLRTSDERRQVIAAYLAVSKAAPLCERSEAELLATGSHTDILSVAYSRVPLGFRSALARAGRKTHPRRFYTYLYAVLASRHAREALAVLAQQPKIDLARLRVMRALPEAIASPTGAIWPES